VNAAAVEQQAAQGVTHEQCSAADCSGPGRPAWQPAFGVGGALHGCTDRLTSE
jgi:hypothetical protein